MRTGLCLGGPRHGEMVTIKGDILRATLPSSSTPSRYSGIGLLMNLPPQQESLPVVIYIWHLGLKIGEDDIVEGFWIPEGTSLKAALKHLFSRAWRT